MTQVGFIQFDVTGTYVQAYGHCPDAEETMTFKKVSDPYAVRNHYISEGAFIERPSSPTPFKIEAGYRIEGCLPSTTILIEDVLSGDLVLEAMIEENEDDFLEFTFEDVGNYRVMVKSPLPHRESVMIIAEELS